MSQIPDNAPTARLGARPSPRRVRALALASLVVLGGLATACGGGSATPAALSTAKIVSVPPVPVQGCAYVLNGQVPTGEYTGTQPSWPAWSPDAAAVAALASIKARGGTGLVYGFSFPTGTHLYAGPDTGRIVATVPQGSSVATSEPVLWATHGGARWLAFFIACGGPNLYWVSLQQLATVSASQAAADQNAINGLLSAKPYQPMTNPRASALPIVIQRGQFTWKDPAVQLVIARGQLLNFP